MKLVIRSARSMTEKYAKAGARESSCGYQCTETKVDSTMSLLRGRFLHERPVEEERPPSMAVSELNQLSHYSEVKYPLACYFIRMCYISSTMSNLSL
uniref:Uncharacterized protein n=1 Tax=Gossypium raimondii TaxID=29730 RepID=A0A0D2NQA2_GOSRA|nr:hypothetical protein B456_002G194600 [Gossypium raimondii]